MKKSELHNAILDILTKNYDLNANTKSKMIVDTIEQIGMLPPLTKVYKPQPVLDECGSHYVVEETRVWDNE